MDGQLPVPRRDGVYVVIGGCRVTGLSALVVRELADLGAGTVVVVGRSKEDKDFALFRPDF